MRPDWVRVSPSVYHIPALVQYATVRSYSLCVMITNCSSQLAWHISGVTLKRKHPCDRPIKSREDADNSSGSQSVGRYIYATIIIYNDVVMFFQAKEAYSSEARFCLEIPNYKASGLQFGKRRCIGKMTVRAKVTSRPLCFYNVPLITKTATSTKIYKYV